MVSLSKPMSCLGARSFNLLLNWRQSLNLLPHHNYKVFFSLLSLIKETLNKAREFLIQLACQISEWVNCFSSHPRALRWSIYISLPPPSFLSKIYRYRKYFFTCNKRLIQFHTCMSFVIYLILGTMDVITTPSVESSMIMTFSVATFVLAILVGVYTLGSVRHKYMHYLLAIQSSITTGTFLLECLYISVPISPFVRI